MPQAVSYAALLREPGAPRAFAASTLARLSYGTVVLSLLLTVQRATGSYGVAGACLGAYGATGFLLPVKSRAIDRRGARAVLPGLGLGYGVALSALAGCAAWGVRAAAPYIVLALVAGVLSPPVGPVMRAIWAALATDAAARQRAYSLDAVVEEVIFAAGPVVTATLITATRPTVGLFVTALLAVSGSLSLAYSSAAAHLGTKDPTHQHFLGVLGLPEFRRLLLVMVAFGAGLSAVDLGVVGRAHGNASVGYVLAALSTGSVVGGLIWGRLALTGSYRTHVAGLLGVLAAGAVAVGLAPTLWVVAGVLFLMGMAIAPLFVVAFVAADVLVTDGSRTEATTWVATAGNMGGSAGAAAAGFVVDHFSPRLALFLGAAVMVLALPALVGGQARPAGPPAP